MTSASDDRGPALTAEDLIDLQVPSDPRISPNGKQVVYAVSRYGREGDHRISSLWIAQVGKEHSARQLTSGFYNDRHARWHPNGESVAFLSDRGKRGESCAIFQLALHGGEAYAITKSENKRQISEFTWSPNGAFIAFLNPDENTVEQESKAEVKEDVDVYGSDWEFNRLRLLHVSTCTVTTLYSNNAHVYSLAWDPESKQIAYVVSKTPQIDSRYHGTTVGIISVASEDNTHICEFPGVIIGKPVWRGSTIFFVAGATPEKCNTSRTVYELSLPKNQWVRLDYGFANCVSDVVLINGMLISKIQSGLSDYIETEDDWYIYSSEHELSAWDMVKTRDCDSDDEDEDGDGEYALVFAKSSVSSPTEIYSSKITRYGAAEHLIQLSSLGQKLVPHSLGTTKIIHCTSSDLTTPLTAVFFTPSTSPSVSHLPTKSLATVVLIHGGPYDRVLNNFDMCDHQWCPYLLSTKQYNILLPNYRGGSSKGEDFAAHARGGVGTVDYDDILSLIDKAIEQGLIDKSRILVGGWSQGGFLSYLLAVRNGLPSTEPKSSSRDWKFEGAICGAGVTDWDMLTMTSDMSKFEAELCGIAPWEAEKSNTTARRGSAIWELQANAKQVPPILILHGEKDKIVPLSQAVAFRRGCERWGVPCEMAVYPREGHPIEERAHLIDMLKRVRRFCDLHLSAE